MKLQALKELIDNQTAEIKDMEALIQVEPGQAPKSIIQLVFSHNGKAQLVTAAYHEPVPVEPEKPKFAVMPDKARSLVGKYVEIQYLADDAHPENPQRAMGELTNVTNSADPFVDLSWGFSVPLSRVKGISEKPSPVV